MITQINNDTLFLIININFLVELQSILFTATGAILHIVAGSVIVYDWRQYHGKYAYVYNNATYASKQYLDMLISGAVFTFVNALVFTGDIIYTIKYSQDTPKPYSNVAYIKCPVVTGTSYIRERLPQIGRLDKRISLKSIRAKRIPFTARSFPPLQEESYSAEQIWLSQMGYSNFRCYESSSKSSRPDKILFIFQHSPLSTRYTQTDDIPTFSSCEGKKQWPSHFWMMELYVPYLKHFRPLFD